MTALRPPEASKGDKKESTPSTTDGASAAWGEVMAKAPPLDVPDGLPEQEQRDLDELARHFEREYAEFRKLWESPSRDDVAAMIQAAASRAADNHCGPWEGYTNSATERWQAHEIYLGQLREELAERLSREAKARGPKDDARWQAQLAQAREVVPPQVCLKCAWNSIAREGASVAFATNDASVTLDAGAGESLLRRIDDGYPAYSSLKTNAGYHLTVRGHADPSEDNPEALALARAQNVRQWMIELGFPGEQIEAIGLDAKLPIAHSPSIQNQRVDFIMEFER